MDPPEAAVGVLRNVVRLCEPGGVVLDLTCLPVPDRMEVDGRLLGYLDQATFLEGVRVTEQAVDLLVEHGLLADEARLEHDVLVHFSSGREAVEHFASSTKSEAPPDLRARLDQINGPVVQRGDSVVRRLRVLPG